MYLRPLGKIKKEIKPCEGSPPFLKAKNLGLLQAIDRLCEALADSSRRERAVVATLAVYLAVWTLYGIIAKSSQDIHVDMAELIAWSRDPALGFLKHPPLAAIVVGIWFQIFPVADWSYYLLAMSVATLALWIAWRLSAYYLSPDKRVVGLALLTLIPFFNFHALKYNVNTILMPLWAATTLWFLRSCITRQILYSALAGIGAAACMYAKYWSIFLLLGLGLAALAQPDRRVYFRSHAPWLTIGVGLVIMIPHFKWLLDHNLAPINYALAGHVEMSFGAGWLAAARYLIGCQLYVCVPCIMILIAAWPDPRTIFDMVWPTSLDHRLIALSFWLPLLIPAVVALIIGLKVVDIWSMPMWTLLPVMLLSPRALTITAQGARNICAVAVGIPFFMVLISPVIAITAFKANAGGRAEQHGQLLAKHVEAAWRGATREPLRFVLGKDELAYEVAAYADDKPLALPGLPQPDPTLLKRFGKAVVCYADSGCAHWTLESAAQDPTIQILKFDLVRKYFGMFGKSQSYLIAIVPPAPSAR